MEATQTQCLPVMTRLRTEHGTKATDDAAELQQFAEEVLNSDDIFPKQFCVAANLMLWRRILRLTEPLYRLVDDTHQANS
jgi:hypothetical protein